MMFPLHFHYEDQGLLLKLNHTNIMEVPGLFEIRLVPKFTSDIKIQFEQLGHGDPVQSVMHTGIVAAPSERRKVNKIQCIRVVPERHCISKTKRHPRAWYIQYSGQGLDSMSKLDSHVAIEQGNCMKFIVATEFCEFSPEIEDHFKIFEIVFGFNMTIVTSASLKEETLLLWSGFLLKDEGEIN